MILLKWDIILNAIALKANSVQRNSGLKRLIHEILIINQSCFPPTTKTSLQRMLPTIIGNIFVQRKMVIAIF